MEKVINIPTTKQLFYRRYLAILSNFPPISNLRNKELDLLALLMFSWDKYANIEEEHRMYLILNKDSKKVLAEVLDVSLDGFNNLLCNLRKYKVLNKDNELSTPFKLLLDGDFTLKFNFKIDE